MKNSKSIHDILAEHDSPLKQVLANAERLQGINALLQQHLEPELAAHCQVLSLHQGKLIIQVDNSSWATQFRYAQPTLLEKLRKAPGLLGLVTINVKVAVPTATNTSKKEKHLTISDKSKQIIQSLAKKIPHEKLANALKKLSE